MAAGVDAGNHHRCLDSIVADERFAARRALRKSLLERRLALTADECVQLSVGSARICVMVFRSWSALAVGFCWPCRMKPTSDR
jgi:hypothetical protein